MVGGSMRNLGAAGPGSTPNPTTGPTIRVHTLRDGDGKSQSLSNILTLDEQAELRSIATIARYPAAGQTIVSEGRDAQFVYTIESGLAMVSRTVENGERQVVGFNWPGDLLGLENEGRYLNSVMSLCPSVLYRFPIGRLRKLLQHDRQLQLDILLKTAEELRKAQRQIVVLGRQDIEGRLAAVLVEFADHPDFFDANRTILRLPLSRADIGDYIGTSPEVVSRAFAKMEADGLLIRSSPRRIQMCNLPGLRQAAQSPSD